MSESFLKRCKSVLYVSVGNLRTFCRRLRKDIKKILFESVEVKASQRDRKIKKKK